MTARVPRDFYKSAIITAAGWCVESTQWRKANYDISYIKQCEYYNLRSLISCHPLDQSCMNDNYTQ